MNTETVNEILNAVRECIIKLNSIGDGLWKVSLQLENLKLEIEVEESDSMK